MKICLDFDGVLHDAAHPVPGRRMGPPCAGALEAVQVLRRHHELVVCTARNDADHVLAWLTYWKFPRLEVSMTKPLADVYVDDKGLHHQDWATTMPILIGRAGSLRMRQTLREGRHR